MDELRLFREGKIHIRRTGSPWILVVRAGLVLENKLMKPITLLLLLSVQCLTAFRSGYAAEPSNDFAKWEKDISTYEQMDRTNPPPQGALLFIGSSTIRLWKTLAEDFPSHRVINRGFGGSQIADATHFAERIIVPYHPKWVFLRAGGNDLAAGKSVERVFADFKEFVAAIRAKLPHTQIVFISLSPSIARWNQADKEKALNQLIEAYAAKSSNLGYIDTWSVPLGPDGKPREEVFVADKLHFNAEGYKLLVERIRPHLPR